MEFDKMTRGEQFLHLLDLEYEGLVTGARFDIQATQFGIEHYAHSDLALEQEKLFLAVRKADLVYYRKMVDRRKRGKYFSGITCTTVV